MDRELIRSEIDVLIDTFSDMALYELLLFLKDLTAYTVEDEIDSL